MFQFSVNILRPWMLRQIHLFPCLLKPNEKNSILCCFDSGLKWAKKKAKTKKTPNQTKKNSSKYIGLAKKFLQFQSIKKRHIFHFHQELYWTTYSLFHSTTFLRQLHNSIFQKLSIFLIKQLFQVPFTVFQGIEVLSIKVTFKNQNKWKSEGAAAGEYGGWIRTS